MICQTLVAYGAQVSTASYGYGGARPAVVGGTPQSRAENRRVVIRVDA
jgi:outer membrane protein OmpA-like peptidoglycan-associated protein